MRGVYCIFQNVVKIGKIFGFGAHSPAPIWGGGKCSDVVLGFDSWSLVVLNDKISVLGIVLALKVKYLALALVLSLESLILFFSLKSSSSPWRWSLCPCYNNNNNKLGRKLADQSGDDREISFLFQRLSVLIQRYNAILLRDCSVKEEEE